MVPFSRSVQVVVSFTLGIQASASVLLRVCVSGGEDFIRVKDLLGTGFRDGFFVEDKQPGQTITFVVVAQNHLMKWKFAFEPIKDLCKYRWVF